MRRLWFKAKDYGWGWVPVTWEGWLVTSIAVGAIVVNVIRIDQQTHSVGDTLIEAFMPTAVIALGLISICLTTGEKPEWRWAGKPIGKPKEPPTV